MVDPAPTHVGDVQQAVDATKIDEGTELGDVRHRAGDELTFLEVGQDSLLGFGTFAFNDVAAADDDVAAFLVDLEDLSANRLADELSNIARATNVDLGGGQEDRHADVDEQAALDLSHAPTFDDVAFGLGFKDTLPTADAIGFAFGQFNDAAAVVEVFKEHLDLVTMLESVKVFEFTFVNETFRLEAHIDDGIVAGLADNLALEDATAGYLLDFASE